MMAENWLQHIALNTVDQIVYNHYHDDTVPVSKKDIFSRYKYRRLIKFLDLKGIKKELIMYNFLDNILTPHHQVINLVVEIVLPDKKICQEKKVEVKTTDATIV